MEPAAPESEPVLGESSIREIRIVSRQAVRQIQGHREPEAVLGRVRDLRGPVCKSGWSFIFLL